MKNPLVTLSLALLLAACGGGGGGAPETPTPPPPPPVVSLSVSASSDQVLAGGAPVTLKASAGNGSAVSWQLAAGAPGSLSAGGGASVDYTPPANGITGITDVVITASAGGSSKPYTLTVYPDPGRPGMSLLAGSAGQRGFVDGKGTAASFTKIQSIAPDNAGGYYVYDATADRLAIRKVSADAEVSTFYSNTARYDDDAHSYANRIAVASNGTVYALARPGGEARLLSFSPTGTASVVLSGAILDHVSNIQPAADGGIYLLKYRSVLKLGAFGAVTTVAGDPATENAAGVVQPVDGAGTAARFGLITAAGVDRQGTLLLRDGASFRRVSAAGVVTTVSLPALDNKRLTSISGAPDGSFYLVTQEDPDNVVYKLSPSTALETVFRGPVPPFASDSPPPVFAVAGSDQRLLLALAAEVRQLSGGKSQAFAGLQDGSGLALDGMAAEARFAQPDMIGADRQGNLYVIDHPGTAYSPYLVGYPGLRGGILRKISPTGQVTTLATDSSILGTPNAMLVDRAGNVYISDEKRWGSKGSTVGSTIVKVAADGTFSTLAGCTWSNDCAPGIADGKGSAARFGGARLLGMDADGNLYAADSWQQKPAFRKITPDGTVSTIESLPAGAGQAPDGGKYELRSGANGTSIVRITPAGTETVAAEGLKGRIWIAPSGPYSLGVIVDETLMKLVVPH